MKPIIRKRWRKFWLEFGWFKGNAPCLFHLDIGMAIEDWPPPKITSVVVFGVQVVKAVFACGVDFE
jgi:hypothetical protein